MAVDPLASAAQAIQRSVNERLADAMIGHQVGLMRRSSGIGNEIVKILEDSRGQLEELLRSRMARALPLGYDPGPVVSARAAVQLEAIRKYVDDVVQQIDDHLLDALGGVADWEVGFQERLLSGMVPLSVNYATPSSNTLKSLITELPYGGEHAKFYGEHISDFAASQFASVAQTVQRGVIAGETVDQLTKNVIGTKGFKFSDGAWTSKKRRYEAETLARTSVNHISTTAREDVYKVNSDIVKSIQIVATLDGRTTLICEVEDGEVYPVGSGPRPPFHYSCRTTTAPVLKGYGELAPELKGKVRLRPKERAMLDGTTSGKVTYNRWLRRQGAPMQDFVLGRYRGRIYRQHPDISIHKFADPQKRMMSLSQLVEQDIRLFLKLSDKEIVGLDQWLKRGQVARILNMKAKKEGRLPKLKAKPKPKPETEFFKARESTFGELREGDVLEMGNNRAKVTSNIIKDDKATITFEMHNADGTIKIRTMTQPASKKLPSDVMPEADMRRSYKPRQMSRAEAIEIFEREIPDNAHNGWFRKEDITYKRAISEKLEESQDARDAALNLLHRQVEDSLGREVPFDEFLQTEYTFYRGGSLSGKDARNTFQSFSLDIDEALKFADKDGDLWEIRLKPSETFGSGQTIAEAEVMVPTETALTAKPYVKIPKLRPKPTVPDVPDSVIAKLEAELAKRGTRVEWGEPNYEMDLKTAKWVEKDRVKIPPNADKKTAMDAINEALDAVDEAGITDVGGKPLRPDYFRVILDEDGNFLGNHGGGGAGTEHGITINMGQRQAVLKRWAETRRALDDNQWPVLLDKELSDTIIHEIGHLHMAKVEKTLFPDLNLDHEWHLWFQASEDLIGDDFDALKRRFISTYSQENEFEMYAETFLARVRGYDWGEESQHLMDRRIGQLARGESVVRRGDLSIRELRPEEIPRWLEDNFVDGAVDIRAIKNARIREQLGETIRALEDDGFRVNGIKGFRGGRDLDADLAKIDDNGKLLLNMDVFGSRRQMEQFNRADGESPWAAIRRVVRETKGEDSGVPGMPVVPEFQDVRQLETWALDHIIDKDYLADARKEHARILALADNAKIDEFGSVAKALEEAEDVLRLVRLEGLGDTARELLEEIIGAQHRFDLPLLRSLGDGKDVEWPTHGSLFSFNKARMRISWNKALFDEFADQGESVETIAKSAFKRGFLSEGNLREMFQHEMMHYIEHFGPDEIRDAMNGVISVAQRGATGQMSSNQFRVLYFRSISGYAAEDDMMFNWNELVAELYAAVYRKGLSGVVPESDLAEKAWRNEMKDAILTLYRAMGMSDPPDVPGPDPMVPRFYRAAAPDADAPDVEKIATNDKIKELLQTIEDGGKIDDDAIYKALSLEDQEKVLRYIGRAEGNEDEYKDIIDAVAEHFKMGKGDFNDPEPGTYFYGPLKKAERVAAKAMADYDGDLTDVGDVLRMTYVVDDPADAVKLLRMLETLDAPEGVKNRMLEPGPGGYRDMILKLVLKDGMKAEVQINNRPMLLAKNGPGHKMYDAMRMLDESTPEWKRLAKESELLYSRAWLSTCKSHPTFAGCPKVTSLFDEMVPGGQGTYAHRAIVFSERDHGDTVLKRKFDGSYDAKTEDVKAALQLVKESYDIDGEAYLARLMAEPDFDVELTTVNASSMEAKDGTLRLTIKIAGKAAGTDFDETGFSWDVMFLKDLRTGKITVHHSEIGISPAQRGLGKRMMWAAFDSYEEMGADLVQLDAADVGAYAWGRYGFAMPQDEWDTWRNHFLRRVVGRDDAQDTGEPSGDRFLPASDKEMAEWFSKLPKSQQQQVIDLLDDPDPLAFHKLVDLDTKVKIKEAKFDLDGEVVSRPTVEMSLGRAVTMSNGWSGEIDLTDDARMVRFWRYTGDEERTFETKKRLVEPDSDTQVSLGDETVRILKQLKEGEDVDDDALYLSLSEADKKRVHSYVDRASGNEPEYNGLIESVADDLGMSVSTFKDPKPNSYFYGPLKTPERVAAKAAMDYDGDLTQVADVLRMTFVVDDPADAMKLYTRLQEIDEPVGLKNRMMEPLSSGYRDVIFKITLKDGMKAEIQINNRPMLIAKSGKGHQLYKRLRKLPEDSPEYGRLARESELLYGRAWRRTCLEHPEFPGCPARKTLQELLPEKGGYRVLTRDEDGAPVRGWVSREQANKEWKKVLHTDSSLDDYIDEIANGVEGVHSIDTVGVAIDELSDKTRSVAVTLGLKDSRGKRIAFISRTFFPEPDGSIRVHHHTMKVQGKYRGAGKEIMQASLRQYEKIGVRMVVIPSAEDVGAYAWPRYGFIPRQKTWDNYRRNLSAIVRQRAAMPEGSKGFWGDLPDKAIQELLQILDDPDRMGLGRIANLETVVAGPGTKGPEKLGVYLLRNNVFQELTLDMDDPGQMVRMLRYIGDDEMADIQERRLVKIGDRRAPTDELELRQIEARLATRKAFDDAPGEHAGDKEYIDWLETEADDALKKELEPEIKRMVEQGSTKAMHTDADGNYTPERLELHEEIINYVMKNILTGEKGTEEVEELTYHMMGGGIAAGKTTSIRSGFVKLPRGHAMISADDIKNMLPEYQKLLKVRRYDGAEIAHRESSELTWEINRRLQARALNHIVLDGTADGGLDEMVTTLERTRAAGYRIVADYSSNPTDLAVFYSKGRAEKTGRWVAEGVTRQVHKTVSIRAIEFLELDLFDEIRIWDTEISGKARAVLEAKRGGKITVKNRAALRRFLDKGGPEARDAWDRIMASDRVVEFRGAKHKLRKMLAESEGKEHGDKLGWGGTVSKRVEGSRITDVADLDEIIEEVRESLGVELEDYISLLVKHSDEATKFNYLDIDVDLTSVRPKVTISLEMLDDNGKQIARLKRTIYRSDDGSLVARHTNFYIEKSHRGMGRDMMHDMVEFYERMGVSRVEIPLAADVGPYAWARYGFEMSPSQWSKWRKKLVRILAGQGEDNDIDFEGGFGDQKKMIDAFNALGHKEQQVVLRILNDPDPRAMWKLVDLDTMIPDPDGISDPLKLGQVLSAENSYWGPILDLHDPDQMARFWGYVGNKYKRELARDDFAHNIDEVLKRQGLSYRAGREAARKMDDDAPGESPGDEAFVKWLAKEAEGEERDKIQADVDEWFEPGTKPQTDKMHKDADGNYTPERQELHEDILHHIVHKIIDDPKNVDLDELTFHMMGGGTASGKSTGIEAGYVHLPRNHAILNADLIKDWLPEYQQLIKLRHSSNAQVVHEESSYLVKEALRRIQEARRTHFVLDGTGDGKLEGLRKKILDARAQGYRVVADYNSLPESLAQKLAKMREAQTGRGVPSPIISGNHQIVPVRAMQMLEEDLFDEIRLWDNEVRGVAKRILSTTRGNKIVVINRDALTRFLDKAPGREAWDVWDRIVKSGRVEYVTPRQRLEHLLRPRKMMGGEGVEVERLPEVKLAKMKATAGGVEEVDIDLDQLDADWRELFGKDQDIEDWITGMVSESDETDRLLTMRIHIDQTERSALISMEYADKDGGKLFNIMRTFDIDADGKITVSHDSFYIEEKARGLGKTVMRNSVDYYEKAGIRKIKMPAAVSNGAYAWPRYGFVPDQDSWDELRKRISQALIGERPVKEANWGGIGNARGLRALFERLDPERRRTVLKILDNPDPKSIWRLSDLDDMIDLTDVVLPSTEYIGPPIPDKMKLGRLLLYRNNWGNGELDLDDDEAMTRFWKYVNNNYQAGLREEAMERKALPPRQEVLDYARKSLDTNLQYETKALKTALSPEDYDEEGLIEQAHEKFVEVYRKEIAKGTAIEAAHREAEVAADWELVRLVDIKVAKHANDVARKVGNQLKANPTFLMKLEADLAPDTLDTIHEMAEITTRQFVLDRIRGGKSIDLDLATQYHTASVEATLSNFVSISSRQATDRLEDIIRLAVNQSGIPKNTSYTFVPGFARLTEQQKIELREAFIVLLRRDLRDKMREYMDGGSQTRKALEIRLAPGPEMRARHLLGERAPGFRVMDQSWLRSKGRERAEGLADTARRMLEKNWAEKAADFTKRTNAVVSSMGGDTFDNFGDIQRSYLALMSELEPVEVPDELLKPLRLQLHHAFESRYLDAIWGMPEIDVRDLVKTMDVLPDRVVDNVERETLVHLLEAMHEKAFQSAKREVMQEYRTTKKLTGAKLRTGLLRAVKRAEKKKRDIDARDADVDRLDGLITETRRPFAEDIATKLIRMQELSNVIDDPDIDLEVKERLVPEFNKLSAEVQELRKRSNVAVAKLMQERRDIFDEEDAVDDAARNYIYSRLKVKDDEGVNTTMEYKIDVKVSSEPKDVAATEDGAHFVSSIWHRGVGNYHEVEFQDAPEPPVGRWASHYTANGVYLRQGAYRPTVVHELGHWIEDNDPEVHKVIEEFLRRRWGQGLPQWLGPGYDQHEVAIADKFRSAYVGKVYVIGGGDKDDPLYASEVLSMGLQYLFENPVEFARDDPDMFEFIVNLVLDNLKIGPPPVQVTNISGSPAAGFPNLMSAGHAFTKVLKPVNLAVGRIRLVDRIITLNPPPLWTYTLNPEQRGFIALTEYLVKIGVVTYVTDGEKWNIDEERLAVEFGLRVNAAGAIVPI